MVHDRSVATDDSWNGLLEALDRGAHHAVREELERAQSCSTVSSESIGEIGVVMKRNADVRQSLDARGRRCWDAVRRAVNRVWRGLVP